MFTNALCVFFFYAADCSNQSRFFFPKHVMGLKIIWATKGGTECSKDLSYG